MKKLLLTLSCFICAGILYAQQQTQSGPLTFTLDNVPSSGNSMAVVDMNGDHLDDIVSVTATNIQILQQLSTGGFTEINITTTPADFPASWSLAAADYDANGYTDLLYGAGSGVTFMRANEDGTAYTEISGPEYVFSQRSNFVDINNDGHLDAFVCHDVEPNVYYINDGSGTLNFVQGGLGDYPSGGNYGSVWIDYEGDGDVDLFIAKCGGEPARRTNQLHQNNGDGTFTEIGLAAGLADPMQTWSSAWGDFDNDGDMDVFVGASSGTHKLMENNGDGTFTDVTAASGVSILTATGIENCTHDLDNDGNLDIVSNGNVLLGNGDLTFSTLLSGVLPGNNGALGDLNNDGFIDSYSGNTLYRSNGNSNNWITINTVGTVSNIDGIGARVIIETPSGTQIRDVRSGEGFSLMSSMNTHFGIGTDTEISSITVVWPSGIVNVVEDPAINQSITIVEEEVLAVGDLQSAKLVIYPNPVQDILNISSSDKIENAVYIIYDNTGRMVTNKVISSNSIDVSTLAAGTYFIKLVNNGTMEVQKFLKK
jgi:hypothetical protein